MTGTPGAAPLVTDGQLRMRPWDDLVADETRLEALLPEQVLAVSETELRRRARRLLAARVALARRRAAVGERADFDKAHERTVLAARAEADRARAGLARAADASHRLLALGNVCGLVMIGGCIVAVFMGASPLSTPVAVGIMSAAGGPIGAVVGGWRGRTAARQAHAAALDAWTDALATAGMRTMGDLAVARIRHEAWRHHARELELAAEEEDDARRAWHEVAGADIDPAAIGALTAAVRQLRAAKLGLLQHRLAAFVHAREAPEIDLRDTARPQAAGHLDPRRVLADVAAAAVHRRRPSSANHPAVAGMALRRLRLLAEDTPAPDDGDHVAGPGAEDGPHRVLELLDRIKEKGLQLWVNG